MDSPGTAGATLDQKYRLSRVLGGGGMGVVFEAEHVALRRTCAVKVLSPALGTDPGFFLRFQREAQALARLSHPAIVQVSDFGVDPQGSGTPYLVMELLEGETLADRLARAPLSLDETAGVLQEVAGAMAHAHDRGVIHGDLASHNVHVAADARGGTVVKVIDFGLASIAGDAAADATAFGSLPYLAPELARGLPASEASDVYAFGVLAYEVLTSRRPFEGSPEELRRAHETIPPVRPSRHAPHLPAEVDRAILDALSKRPADRPPLADVASRIVQGLLSLVRRRWYQDELPERVRVAAVMAVTAAVLAIPVAGLQPVAALDRWWIDARLAASPRKAPDRRLLIVSLDDAALAAEPAALVSWGDEVGTVISRLIENGALAVALDVLVPAAWGRSAPFGQTVTRHADRIVLANATGASGDVIGVEAAAGLVSAGLGPRRATDLFASVDGFVDRDGRARYARAAVEDTRGRWQPTLAGRVAHLGGASCTRSSEGCGTFLVDYRIEWQRIERIPWSSLSTALARQPQIARDRLVFIGAEYTGSGDTHRVPWREEQVSGVTLQALAASTLLDAGRPAVLHGRAALAAGSTATFVVAFAAACAVLLVSSRMRSAGLLAAAAGLWIIFTLSAARLADLWIPTSNVLCASALAAGAAAVARQRLRPFPRRPRMSFTEVRQPRIAAAALGVMVVFGAATTSHAADASEPVAVVVAVKGAVAVRPPEGERRPLQRFDWIQAGAALSSADPADVEIVFADGSRYAVRGRLEVRVRSGDLLVRSGELKTLSSVPALPLVHPVKRPIGGAPPAAVRIRSTGNADAYPIGNAATSMESTWLDVRSEACENWDARVEDQAGGIVWSADGVKMPVHVPADALRGGRTYWWAAVCRDAAGAVHHAEGRFLTLTPEQAGRWKEFRAGLLTETTADRFALAAEVEWRIGLFKEAIATYRQAAALAPGDASIGARLEHLQRTLAGRP
jgi:CHASE2 domain-containing sensor protein